MDGFILLNIAAPCHSRHSEAGLHFQTMSLILSSLSFSGGLRIWLKKKKKNASMFFEVQNPHIQQFLWRRIVLDYPYTPWLMDGLICILFPASEFPRRVTLVHNGTTIHIFLRFHCLSFHMIFAQPSISDLEPHSRGSRIDGEGTLFSFPSMRHALLDCCSLTSLSSHKVCC